MRLAAPVVLALAIAGCGSAAPAPTAQDQPTADPADQVVTKVTECRFDGMRGTVENQGAVAVDVTLLYQWLDGSTLTDSATEVVPGLAPGQKSRFNVTRPATGRATDCTAEVRSAVVP